LLFVYDKKQKVLVPAEMTDFKTHAILERRDIEKWVVELSGNIGRAAACNNNRIRQI
jgi:hypothetical protein